MRAAVELPDHPEPERDVVDGVGNHPHDLVLKLVDPRHAGKASGHPAFTRTRPGAGSGREAHADGRLRVPHNSVQDDERLGIEHVALDDGLARPGLGGPLRARAGLAASRGGQASSETPVLGGQV